MYKILILLISLATASTVMAQGVAFEENELYPEGLAFSKKQNSFYVSSIHYGKIGKVDWQGQYTPFVESKELVSSLGMLVDEEKNLLWVCIADPGVSIKTGQSTQGKLAKLVAYDLNSGDQKASISLDDLNQGNGNFANDLTMDKKGNLYITNSFSPIIFKVDQDHKATVFAKDERWKKEGFSLNGIAFHKKGYLLASQSNTGKIYRISISDPSKITEVEVPLIPGADGIIMNSNKELIVISNSEKKVYQLLSRDGWKSARIAKTEDSKTAFPTTGVQVRGANYILNAKLNEIFDPSTPNSSDYLIQKVEF